MQRTTLIITNIREQARDTRSFDLKLHGISGHHGLTFSPGQVAILKVAPDEQGYFAFAGGLMIEISKSSLSRKLVRAKLFSTWHRGNPSN